MRRYRGWPVKVANVRSWLGLSEARTRRLKEQDMKLGESTLRSLIEKWFAPTATNPVHLTRFTSPNSGQTRCVLARSCASESSLAIFFFRHDDGAWRVFPPPPRKPEMHFYAATG